jgi:hypothetical protein
MDDNVSQPWRNCGNRMKNILIIIFSTIALLASSQDTVKFSLDDNINGSYSKYSDNNNIINVGFVGDNSIGYKKMKFNNVSNYSLSFRDSITANELVNKTNIEYVNIFLFNVYTNSLIRSIKNDNSFGVGYSHKFSIKKVDISISYAILYQKTFYRNLTEKEIGRNSVRVKIKYNGGLVGFSTEFYYQPSFKSMQTDYIIYGNAKIVFLPKKRINFILQDAINYISTSKVRILHNLAFGIEYNFKN